MFFGDFVVIFKQKYYFCLYILTFKTTYYHARKNLFCCC